MGPRRDATDFEFVAFRSRSSGDPEGSKVAAMLGAHVSWQLARARRSRIAHALAVVSAPVWIAAVLPYWPFPRLRAVALSAWVLGVVGLAIAGLAERRWRRRCARALAEVGWPPGEIGS